MWTVVDPVRVVDIAEVGCSSHPEPTEKAEVFTSLAFLTPNLTPRCCSLRLLRCRAIEPVRVGSHHRRVCFPHWKVMGGRSPSCPRNHQRRHRPHCRRDARRHAAPLRDRTRHDRGWVSNRRPSSSRGHLATRDLAVARHEPSAQSAGTTPVPARDPRLRMAACLTVAST